jgi:hypothetical protein
MAVTIEPVRDELDERADKMGKDPTAYYREAWQQAHDEVVQEMTGR